MSFSKNNISCFSSDPFGRRILKISKPCTTGVPGANTTWTYTYYVNDASGNVIATYSYDKGASAHTMTLDEQMVYGSSRLGLRDRSKLLSTFTISGSDLDHTSADGTERTLGSKRYEYTNHLGNVLLVTTDRKMSKDPNTNGTTDYYHAVVDAYYDYGPFGNVLEGRKDDGYRYGFNGQEKDDEVYGVNNATSAEYWMYDARLGRRWNNDPIRYPWQSPYAAFNNNPIYFADPLGLEGTNGDNTLTPGDYREEGGSEGQNPPEMSGYVLNEVVVEAKAPTEQEQALFIIDEFERTDQPFDPAFSHISKEKIVSDLRERVNSGGKEIMQSTNTCGLAALANIFAKHDPKGYVKFTLSLYQYGSANNDDWTYWIHGGHGVKEWAKDANPDDYGGSDGADLVFIGSIKIKENGIWGFGNDWFTGLTGPSTITKVADKLLGLKEYNNGDGTFNYKLKKADEMMKNGEEVFAMYLYPIGGIGKFHYQVFLGLNQNGQVKYWDYGAEDKRDKNEIIGFGSTFWIFVPKK